MKEHIKEIYSGVRFFQIGNKRFTGKEMFELLNKVTEEMEREEREYEAANQEQVRQVV